MSFYFCVCVCDFIFYNKIALRPISYVVKMFAEKIFAGKMFMAKILHVLCSILSYGIFLYAFAPTVCNHTIM